VLPGLEGLFRSRVELGNFLVARSIELLLKEDPGSPDLGSCTSFTTGMLRVLLENAALHM